MDKKVIYRKSYRMLKDLTPLKYDCGILCKSKCCSGNTYSGMHLYPGEEAMLDNTNFLSIRNERFANSEISFAICKGKCVRNLRPLACRVYPLVPYIDLEGKLNVIEDPRAMYTCPLLLLKDDYRINPLFRQKVRSAFQLLVQDSEIRNYIENLSDVLREYSLFTGAKLPY